MKAFRRLNQHSRKLKILEKHCARSQRVRYTYFIVIWNCARVIRRRADCIDCRGHGWRRLHYDDDFWQRKEATVPCPSWFTVRRLRRRIGTLNSCDVSWIVRASERWVLFFGNERSLDALCSRPRGIAVIARRLLEQNYMWNCSNFLLKNAVNVTVEYGEFSCKFRLVLAEIVVMDN